MKILYVSTERGWHGGEEQLRLLVDGVTGQGHEVRLVARATGEFYKRMLAAGRELVALPSSARGPQSLLRLRREIIRFRPDIVHANDPHALTLARLASWRRQISGRVASRRVLFPIRSAKKYIAWCDRVVCVSAAIAEECRRGGIPDRLIRVVHSGIDPKRCAIGDASRGREALGLAADVPLLLCVAQLAEYKGHRYLIEAMTQVVKQFPQAVLALAGDGPLRAELAALAEEHQVADSVWLLGYRTDVPDLLAASDLFVLPSTAEGLGTAVLDAMFAEKPVVAANAGGIPEMLAGLVGEPPVGWLVPPKDADALAVTLIEAIESPEMRLRYGREGRRRAERGFTHDDMVRGLLGVYEELLN